MHKLLSSLNILLAEDNLADARLVKEVMREGKFLATLHHVEDGVETMAFLRRQSPYQDKPKPDLLLLDLNMPRKDGWEVLDEIRADRNHHRAEHDGRLPARVLEIHADFGREIDRIADFQQYIVASRGLFGAIGPNDRSISL